MNNSTPHSRPDAFTKRWSLLGLASAALLFSACASSRAVTKTDWLPDSDGWTVRDSDEHQPPRWVVYERDAQAADVKEIRVVGVVDAEPAAVAQALRTRLLDDSLLPEGIERKILRESEAEVEHYALSPMPFPFDDREVNERLQFTHDPDTGIHTIDVESVDPGDAAKPGVLRIPLIKNQMVIAPAGPGRSAVTMDSVHDMGGNFPNWAIYGPIADYLVDEIAALNALTAPDMSASR